jgi:hypothetical protein
MSAVAGKTDRRVYLECEGCGTRVKVNRPIVDGKYADAEAPESCVYCPRPEDDEPEQADAA